MEYEPHRDRPRPESTAKQCVDRLLRDGSNHAFVDLLDALEKDDDPRGDTLQDLLHHTLGEIAQIPEEDPQRSTALVSHWQALCVGAVRVMKDPLALPRAQAVRDLHRRHDRLLGRLS